MVSLSLETITQNKTKKRYQEAKEMGRVSYIRAVSTRIQADSQVLYWNRQIAEFRNPMRLWECDKIL